MKRTLSVLTLALLGLAWVVGPVMAEDLEDMLGEVGEAYGRGYASPFVQAFGPNMNSALYQTAHIPWGGLNFGVGLKVMATQLNEDDQTFKKVISDVDLGQYDAAWAGETGDIVMSGPTIFGDTETDGTITGYWHGLPVFEQSTISGKIDSRYVPLATPELFVGGIFGLKGTLRFFPELDMGDFGKTKYMGYGLQWSPNGLMPTFPVDLMIGFFDQELTVGSVFESRAKTFFLGASKETGPVTVYGGFAKEEADMTVTYTYEGDGSLVAFDASSSQESRMTLGVAMGAFNVELGLGDLVTYSAGAMLGF